MLAIRQQHQQARAIARVEHRKHAHQRDHRARQSGAWPTAGPGTALGLTSSPAAAPGARPPPARHSTRWAMSSHRCWRRRRYRRPLSQPIWLETVRPARSWAMLESGSRPARVSPSRWQGATGVRTRAIRQAAPGRPRRRPSTSWAACSYRSLVAAGARGLARGQPACAARAWSMRTSSCGISTCFSTFKVHRRPARGQAHLRGYQPGRARRQCVVAKDLDGDLGAPDSKWSTGAQWAGPPRPTPAGRERARRSASTTSRGRSLRRSCTSISLGARPQHHSSSSARQCGGHVAGLGHLGQQALGLGADAAGRRRDVPGCIRRPTTTEPSLKAGGRRAQCRHRTRRHQHRRQGPCRPAARMCLKDQMQAGARPTA